jgi:hypothetical protein
MLLVLIPCFSAFSAGLVHDHASPLFYYFLFPVSSWAGDQVDSPFFLRNAIHFLLFLLARSLSLAAATLRWLGAAARALLHKQPASAWLPLFFLPIANHFHIM